ncbi:MAG: helix-hairpin-helix domain-containing protein [Deltaproteobacteria bacterium]|nr:helix-hairpin-helix domain-containing protein [Deltaproteobacteria bacterium]MBW2051068.1 helix-hairpin-helix domain-containing protein [Deltaproteobacteria bacterium]MBW2141005.1 helix-hairpin-helix domain-containing protein [Deltaproteobacteria bacterium]MBW2322885.1 helix-hairpin-helix domain-containing protein [Deltaproteobacteria bacterium]
MDRVKITRLLLTSLWLLFVLTISVAVSAGDEEKLTGKTANINTADVEDLTQVPLITRDLAERIVEYREEVGDFQVLEELLQVDGFTYKLLERLRPFLLLEGLGGDDCTC